MDVTGTINTKDPAATHKEVARIYEKQLGTAISDSITQTLEAIVALFDGRYPGYQKCDTKYHDLEHTLQAYLAAARIFDGRIKENSSTDLKEQMETGLIASLGHDTGFIKETNDLKGTGAKYSLIHVDRSKSFMSVHLQKLGLKSPQIQCVNNAISCTGLESDLSKIPFISDEGRITGYIVGTADFLGQMSDPEYLKKLPSLFNEYQEGGVPGYSSAEDLIKKTPSFFEEFVMKRLTDDFHSVYQYLTNHFGGKNTYIEGIQHNIEKIRNGNRS